MDGYSDLRAVTGLVNGLVSNGCGLLFVSLVASVFDRRRHSCAYRTYVLI
ncbi:hypothetical protein ETAA8_42950 [Anatilimnocola aggregata]|uniref:Uncharacterized protein n=1 Tax=Anatilimnocola aggregata TaxID=2528021 RepID=A0A517YG36_9BACT|nr:hypothetical protein ETAA8_42950 [Anatilimnocola aggregata]